MDLAPGPWCNPRWPGHSRLCRTRQSPDCCRPRYSVDLAPGPWCNLRWPGHSRLCRTRQSPDCCRHWRSLDLAPGPWCNLRWLGHSRLCRTRRFPGACKPLGRWELFVLIEKRPLSHHRSAGTLKNRGLAQTSPRRSVSGRESAGIWQSGRNTGEAQSFSSHVTS